MKRRGKKGPKDKKGGATARGLFGMTPKKPEPDDKPGRAARMGPPEMSGMPGGGKLSKRARGRLKGRPI